jgi:hypothetical protein
MSASAGSIVWKFGDLQALQYVRNTNGGANVEAFIEDHEPIGQWLWDKLSRGGLVRVNRDTQRIYLTSAGDAALKDYKP